EPGPRSRSAHTETKEWRRKGYFSSGKFCFPIVIMRLERRRTIGKASFESWRR
ncbi:unnamed protein product, partial [Gulo gulo]